MSNTIISSHVLNEFCEKNAIYLTHKRRSSVLIRNKLFYKESDMCLAHSMNKVSKSHMVFQYIKRRERNFIIYLIPGKSFYLLNLEILNGKPNSKENVKFNSDYLDIRGSFPNE